MIIRKIKEGKQGDIKKEMGNRGGMMGCRIAKTFFGTVGSILIPCDLYESSTVTF